MNLEKNLLLFIHVIYFLYALCDDAASISQETRTRLNYISEYITKNFTSNYDFKASESLASASELDFDPSKDLTVSTNFHESVTTIPYESSIENEKLLKEGIQLSTTPIGSSYSIANHFMQSIPLVTRTTTVNSDDKNTTFSNNSTTDEVIYSPNWILDKNGGGKGEVNLTIECINTEWITLAWKSPYENKSSIIYLIERCDDNNCTQVNQSDERHNATGLQPCTEYRFNVKVVIDSWISNGVNKSATTDHAISEIGDVVHLEVHNVSINNIQLTWQEPVINTKCISGYSVMQCNEMECKNDTTNSTTHYSAENLEPCTKYHFIIKTLTLTVQSAGVNVTQRTASEKFPELEFIEIESGNFSLTVKWKPPENNIKCLKHYQVSVDPGSTIETTIEESIVIRNLYACSSYNVCISAVNLDNENGNLTCRNNMTLKSVTKPPVPQNVTGLVTANSISIIWSIEKEDNHCPLQSIMITCNYMHRNGTGYEPVNGLCMMKFVPENDTDVIIANTTIEDLSPFTTYKCWAYTINTAGSSNASNQVIATTAEDIPSPPSFSVTNITDTQFSFTWELPQYIPGNLKDFEIKLVWNTLFPIPEWCPGKSSINEKIVTVNGSTLNYDYLTAIPFTNYTVTMRARTYADWGDYGAPQIFSTKYAVPDPVQNITHSIKENSRDRNILDTTIKWGLPCFLNGELDFFNITIHGTRDKFKPDYFYIEDKCVMHDNYVCSVKLRELKGEYNYTCMISTKIKQLDTLGRIEREEIILYPAGIPPQPEERYIKAITIDPYESQKSTTTAAILLPIFLDTNGFIKHYAIMISERGYNNNQSSRRFDLKSNEWPDAFTWKEAVKNNFAITYQATPRQWNLSSKYVVQYGSICAVKYIIGEDTVCKRVSSNQDKSSDKPIYCNGPLKPDTWYDVRMRAFTDGGYTDSDIFKIKTNAELNIAIVIGVVFGILFLGILTTMMLLVRKCSPHIVLRRFLHSDMPDSPVPSPFTRKKFIAHCQQLVDNPGKLSNEFRLLQTLSVDLQMPTNSACLQANKKKNRYSDILPYDFSRVKLEVIDNDPNTDYINASLIKGYTGEDEYIACQGPKEETTYDFWRMIDQYDINIIIMLTQLIEKGKEKCHQYFPTIKEAFRYENMTIRCTSELEFRTYTQRILMLQKEDKKKNITHLHFKNWPDHDVPEDFDLMINFCQIMRRNINATKGFVVVHCSAGIGRTGTLIAIDILLQHLRDNRKIDVFGTVYRLRHHRINMVQRETQYAYIYNCIKQVLKNPYFLKTYKPPAVEPIYENISKNARNPTNSLSDINLVSNVETLKRYNSSIKSVDSIWNLFSWANTVQQRSIANHGLRHYKSMDVINVKSCHITIGKSKTLECIIYKLEDSSRNLSKETLIEENYPLLTYSRSIDVLGDSMQYATDKV